MHLNPAIDAFLKGFLNPSLPVIDLSLSRMEKLLAALGSPQLRLPPVVHIAGTNGKGSTLAFLRAMAEADGKRLHVYTSPHLVRFNERIVLAGKELEDAALLPLLQRVAEAARSIPVTFFEATTAAAFLAFAENPGDFLLLETGLGGRLDATNMVPNPALTLITPIGLDHMEFLGGSLAQIAKEKAGIMKSGVTCIVAAQVAEAASTLIASAEHIGAPLMLDGRDWYVGKALEGLPAPSLAGTHQRHNAALAVMAARHLGISSHAIANGVSTAHWPGRMQRLTHGVLVEAWGTRGDVIVDGAHNAHAAEALVEWMASRKQPITLICGMMARKDATAFFETLVPYVRELLTITLEENGAYGAEELGDVARVAGIDVICCPKGLASVAGVLQACESGTLLITGSLFLAGEVLKNHG
jgi:dihydrofolate synthase/folylpolyglutamate synthase